MLQDLIPQAYKGNPPATCPAWWMPVSAALTPTWGAYRMPIRMAFVAASLAYPPAGLVIIGVPAVIDFMQSCRFDTAAKQSACDMYLLAQVLSTACGVMAAVLALTIPPLALPLAAASSLYFLCGLASRYVCNGKMPSTAELNSIGGHVSTIVAGASALASPGQKEQISQAIAACAAMVTILGRAPSESEAKAFLTQWGGAKPPPLTVLPSQPMAFSGTLGPQVAVSANLGTLSPTALPGVLGSFGGQITPSDIIPKPPRGTVTTTTSRPSKGTPSKGTATSTSTGGGSPISGTTPKEKSRPGALLVVAGIIGTGAVLSMRKKKKK